jgi:hypothetical protein
MVEGRKLERKHNFFFEKINHKKKKQKKEKGKNLKTEKTNQNWRTRKNRKKTEKPCVNKKNPC